MRVHEPLLRHAITATATNFLNLISLIIIGLGSTSKNCRGSPRHELVLSCTRSLSTRIDQGKGLKAYARAMTEYSFALGRASAAAAAAAMIVTV